MRERFECIAEWAVAERIYCYDHRLEYTTHPKTPGQWVKYVVIVLVALLMVYLLLRTFVL